MNDESLFDKARRIDSPGERAAFLEQACGSDVAIRQRVEALLAADGQTDSLLDNSILPAGQTADFSTSDENPGDSIGCYKLLQEIGEGGFGVVYLAEQSEPVSRRVALKVIKPGMDSRQVIARFEAERQALAMMDHPNIAKVYDAGMTGTGRPYFVMELVKGLPITKFCDQQKLAPRARLELFLPVCRAIQHAHQKGIIHRDIKPSNILVSLYDGHPVPKVIDFGVAKAIQHRLTDKTLFTQYGQVIGTLEYMSPEQAEMNQLDIDTRSDIYSLGAVLYELLTGTTPFDRKKLRSAAFDEMLRIIREEEPVRPSYRLSTSQELASLSLQRQTEPAKLSRMVQGDLDWVTMKALHKQRTLRYETADALAQDIDRFLNDEPVAAGPPSSVYRWRKFVRKHRASLSVAACFLLLLLAGTIVSTWQWSRAHDAAVAAAESETKAGLRAKEANRARTEAEAAKTAADEQSQLRLKQLVQTNVAAGAQFVRDFDYPKAALHFSEAMRLDRGNAARERIHRMRCTSALAACPKPVMLWNAGKRAKRLKISSDGGFAMTFDEPQSFTLASGEAIVWEVATGKRMATLPHAKSVLDAEFSSDLRFAATACADGTAQVWELPSGKPVGQAMKHELAVTHVRFNNQGDRIVTTTGMFVDWQHRDKLQACTVFDVPSGEPIFSVTHNLLIRDACFSPDGALLATASDDGTARIWDAQIGLPKSAPLKHASGGEGVGVFGQVRFIKDGKWLLTGGLYDSHAITTIWDVATGTLIAEVPGANFRDYTEDGLQVLTSTTGTSLYLWQPKIPRRFRTGGSSASVARISPDRHFVLTADSRSNSDFSVNLWDTESWRSESAPLIHSAPVLSAEFLPDGRRVISLDADGLVRVWDLATGLPSGDRFDIPGYIIPGISFSSSRQFVCFTTGAGRLAGKTEVWEIPIQRRLASIQHSFRLNHSVISPDGTYVILFSGRPIEQEEVQVWDVATSEQLGTIKLPKSRDISQINAIKFSPDSQHFAVAGPDNRAQVWSTRTLQPISPFMEHSFPVRNLSFSNDGTFLATAAGVNQGNLQFGTDDRGEARVWEIPSGRLVQHIPHDAGVTTAEFSSDGKRILTACSHRNPDLCTAQVWNIEGGQRVSPLVRHSGSIPMAIFTASDTQIVTISVDGTARVWDIESGSTVTAPMTHGDGYPVSVEVQGDLLLTQTSTRAQLWDTTTGFPATLPLRSLAGTLRGNDVVITAGSFGIHSMTLVNEQLMASDCVLLSQLLAGEKLLAGGSDMHLTSQEYERAWNDISTRVVLAATPQQMEEWNTRSIDWHRSQMTPDGDPGDALFHIGRVLALSQGQSSKTDVRREAILRRAQSLAQMENWEEAVRDFRSALLVTQGPEYFEQGALAEYWYEMLTTCLKGNLAGEFRTLCAEMKDRFDLVGSRALATRLVDAALLLPSVFDDWHELITIANTHGIPPRSRAAMLFRSGAYQQSLLKFEELEDNPTGADLAFMAMAHFRLKRFDEARQTLKLGKEWAEEAERVGLRPFSPFETELLLTEATSMIGPFGDATHESETKDSTATVVPEMDQD